MPLSSSSSAQRCGAALRTGVGSLSASGDETGTGALTGVGSSAGLAAGKLTYPHQLHDNPSFGIPDFGTPSTVPQAAQVIVARMDPATTGRSVRDALGDPHEHVFQVDFFLLEHTELVAGLDQALGEETAIFSTVPQHHLDDLALFEQVHTLDLGVSGQDLGRFLVAIGSDRDEEDVLLPDLSDRGVHVAIEQELAALDDADLIADVGQFGQDVAGDEDRLLHTA